MTGKNCYLKLLCFLLCVLRQYTGATIISNLFRKIPGTIIPDHRIVKTIIDVSTFDCINNCHRDMGCNSLRYLSSNRTCEFSSGTMVVSSTNPIWQVYIAGPYRYELVKNAMTWYEGKDYCESKFGTLAIINSQSVNDVIKTGLIAHGHNWDSSSSFGPWLGANDLANPNVYVWLDGSQLTGEFENWMVNNPDGSSSNEDCVHMAGPPNSPLFEWNDYYCQSHLWCICQYH